ncbi:leucine rich repeat domain protein [Teladorsagia circumcincta]|uniref:Leucine rich repeat domain protein n=1 Tax=Teladorsagia circumcincta TaxID=45464 RepID=A0A2G9UL07_TELCI|nr:leucine rich repeat domain protein [Teladorsagia circumcincta]
MMLDVFLVMATVISTSHLCPSMCDCTAQGRVDCSQRELTQVPPGIPPSTRYLDLRGNLLEVLPRYSLSGLGENLVHLDLSKNNLRNIDPNAFRGLKKLRTLYASQSVMNGSLSLLT